jgi:hypothetical protein
VERRRRILTMAVVLLRRVLLGLSLGAAKLCAFLMVFLKEHHSLPGDEEEPFLVSQSTVKNARKVSLEQTARLR